MRLLLGFLTCSLLTTSVFFCARCSAESIVYFGTYTGGKSTSEGIYASQFDPNTGALGDPKLVAKATNPSFVAIHPSGDYLYAASEAWGGGKDAVGVIAYKIKAEGGLEKLNEKSSGGAGACHVAVDPTGRCVGVANYGGGSCALFPIKSDGSLGESGSFHQHIGNSVNEKRQKEPHAHSINFSVDGTQAIVADLGIDKILVYDVDHASGTMSPADPPFLATPAGGGPRHFCFAPSGDLACANLELTSDLMLLNYDTQTKSLRQLDVHSSLPQSMPGNSTAECLIHPNGNFAYVSNRGHDSIAVFAIDRQAEKLMLVGHHSSGGSTPRGFGIDPSGKFLVVANQKTGEIVSLSVDTGTGKLKTTGYSIQLGSPVNVRFLSR